MDVPFHSFFSRQLVGPFCLETHVLWLGKVILNYIWVIFSPLFFSIFSSFFYFLIFENVIPFSLIPYFFLFYFLSVFFSASRVISSIFTSKTTVEILTSGIICLISKMLVFVLQPSCVPLCDPMDCNTAGFPVPHYLPEFDQIHVY